LLPHDAIAKDLVLSFLLRLWASGQRSCAGHHIHGPVAKVLVPACFKTDSLTQLLALQLHGSLLLLSKGFRNSHHE
jgi:hypothetical protein